MRLRYETGIATLIQFIAMAVLNFGNSIFSGVSGCTNGSNDCVSNIIVTLLYFMLITVWFGFLWVLGYAAQDRRSPRLAQLLMAGEGAVALVAIFDAKHYPNVLGLITSLIDFCLAIWIIFLAFRLMRAKGGRITTTTSRARRRPPKAE